MVRDSPGFCMMENETSYLDSYVNGVMCLFIGMEIKMFKFLELLQSNFSLILFCIMVISSWNLQCFVGNCAEVSA